MFNKRGIIRYIEDKHLSDGGYFFAGIEPSSGLDTYYAVKTLKMLDVKPQNAKSIRDFFLEMEVSEGISDIIGLYLTVETFKELEYNITRFVPYKNILKKTINKIKEFKKTDKIYVENSSELEETYRAIVAAKDLNFSFDKDKIKKFILSFKNNDGGYGSKNLSLLSTTYYALYILSELNLVEEGKETIEYLRRKEKDLFNLYLEDLFYLVGSLYLLKQKPEDLDKVFFFLDCCVRLDGGYSRSTNMGIPTLEDTYYAVTIFTILKSYSLNKFINSS